MACYRQIMRKNKGTAAEKVLEGQGKSSKWAHQRGEHWHLSDPAAANLGAGKLQISWYQEPGSVTAFSESNQL